MTSTDVGPYAMQTAADRTDDHSRFFGLTDIQHAYLFGRRPGLELGGLAPRCYLELAGQNLDIDRFEAAAGELFERHDMLRARLAGEDRLHVADPAPPSVEYADVSGLPQAERDQRLEQTRRRMRAGSDTIGPPVELSLTRVGENRCHVHVAVELLFLDLRSVLRLLAELRALVDGDPPGPAPGRFGDYVAAIDRRAAGAEGQAAAEYWQRRLDHLPNAPELPLAVAPEQLGRPKFTSLRTDLDVRTWQRLEAAARAHGLEPSTLLLAAFTEVVRTWSKNAEFTLTLTAHEPRAVVPGLHEAVGQFSIPSLLEVSAEAGQTFLERAADLQRRMREDTEQLAYSGIQVLRELSRRSDTGRVSMPVVFTSTVGTAAPDGLAAFGELIEISTDTPQVWLENQVIESAEGIVVTWHAVDGLLAAGVLDAMFAAYRDLLDRLATDESLWQQSGSLVPLPAEAAAEQRQANSTASDIPAARLHDLVAEAARRHPDALAVAGPSGELTHGDLAARSYQVARHLREVAAPRPGELVAVCMQAGAEQLAAILGVLHAGGAYVCIDPELPAQRRATLLQRCRVRAVVTDTVLAETLHWPDGVDVVTADGERTRAYSTEAVVSAQGYDDLAYVIFTSGSTGEPKGVMITHRSAANTVQDINERFRAGSHDRVLSLAPTGFDLSVYDIFGVLSAGGAVVVPDPSRAADVHHWSELVARHGVTIWNTVPAPMRLWIDSLEEPGRTGAGDTLRLVLMSGDWIPVDLPDRIRARFPRAQIISLGGATEGSIWSIYHPIEQVSTEWVSIPYGKPLANQRMHVLNRWLQPCPTWVTGEIHIGGVGVAQGYWKDPVRTEERFIVHPATGERLYRTGDLGRYLPGGDIEILGREDHQVKINGYRVELGEIESCLSAAPGVRQVLVTAPQHPRTGQRQIVAYVVPEARPDNGLFDIEALRQTCAESLPSFMVPSHYLPTEHIPLTGNGKIDRAALVSPWADDETSAAVQVAPKDDVEAKVAAIWAKQLGHDEFGTTDGFFDIGGDSLHAVGILREVREELGVSAEAEQDLVETLFMNADVAAFSEVVKRGAA
ncbi:non-ribosomal peptide synthetase [Phytoactinopolyspora mesophila]|nr:non-ribosomal peptide synthetase [Phytoactinopolyspora mesophila]